MNPVRTQKPSTIDSTTNTVVYLNGNYFTEEGEALTG